MAGEDGTACYTCEGTLLVPTVDDRVSHWRERLVSGNRLTITLKVVGQRWSSDACFLLWGENCLQEKMFEVNLRFVRDYFVRTRTWHEITSSDRRRFALSFHDSNQFARFYEELESTLSFLKKLTTATVGSSSRDAGGIVVLRVDKLPPPKPPRATEQTPLPIIEARTPPIEPDRQPWSPEPPITRVVRFGSTGTIDDVADVVSQDDGATTWYVDISDGGVAKLPESKFSDDLTGIYETIVDPISSPHTPDEVDSHVGINTYDHISDDVLYSRPCGTKPYASNNLIDFSDEAIGRVIQGLRPPPVPRRPIETHVYDDRDRTDSYDNIALDFADRQPIAPKSKPRLHPRGGEVPAGGRPTSGVTNDACRQPVLETGATKPQPLPRTKKPKEDKPPGDDWTCRKCTLFNPTTTDRCAACDTTRHRSHVPHVTGSHVPHVIGSRDDALHRLPSSYIVPSACFQTLMADDDKWTCSVCSATNRREADVCGSCSSWVCSHCTLHNLPEIWVCSACAHSRLLPQ